mgnify:CR=1 FL=1|tara:strand:- start:12 stop:626 length:615 start_codon:yes stop_codon:yes gene_type:complete
MAYGKLKVDTITYDNGGSDVDVSVSALAGAGSAAPLASPTFTGTVTIPSGASIADIGTTIQPYDADTAKRDTTNTYTALQTMNAGIAVDGPYKQTAEAVGALAIDLSTGNYFTKTISGNSTFTFTNPPATGTVGSFTLELTHSSGTVAWPDGTGAAGIVRWPADTPPTLTAGKTHIFVFVTDDGSVSSGTGPTYRGAALADYVN